MVHIGSTQINILDTAQAILECDETWKLDVIRARLILHYAGLKKIKSAEWLEVEKKKLSK
jgi:hypothetical protein